MNIYEELKVVRDVLDKQIVDREGKRCGMVDDVLLKRAPEELRIDSLLVGPGAYEHRMPLTIYRLFRKLFGDRVTSIPMEVVKAIDAVVTLTKTAGELGPAKREKLTTNEPKNAGLSIAQLLKTTVRDGNGREFGRIFEVEANAGQITFLVCGYKGILERLGLKETSGKRIAWKNAIDINRDRVIVG